MYRFEANTNSKLRLMSSEIRYLVSNSKSIKYNDDKFIKESERLVLWGKEIKYSNIVVVKSVDKDGLRLLKARKRFCHKNDKEGISIVARKNGNFAGTDIISVVASYKRQCHYYGYKASTIDILSQVCDFKCIKCDGNDDVEIIYLHSKKKKPRFEAVCSNCIKPRDRFGSPDILDFYKMYAKEV